MGRQGNVEHATASKIKNIREMPEGVSNALEMVKELNEEKIAEAKPKAKTKAPMELRDLVLFGRIIEDYKIGGYTIKLSTLTNRQQKDLLSKLLKLNNEERLMSVKTATLAEAIISINEVPLTELYQGQEDLTDSEKRNEVVSDLQSNLVEKLFIKYEDMVTKSNKLFEEGDLGEEIKN